MRLFAYTLQRDMDVFVKRAPSDLDGTTDVDVGLIDAR